MEHREINQNRMSYGRPMYVDSNALKLRLDTDKLIERLELYLRGAKLIIERDASENYVTKTVEVGKKKANDEGIQSILNWVSATINPQTVQGNFYVDAFGRSDAYDRYIEEYQIELAKTLTINCVNWEIKNEELSGLIAHIMLLVQPFMSRLIENKERESYSESLKSIETNTTRDKTGFPFIQ